MKQNNLRELAQIRFLLLLLEIPRIFDCDFNAVFNTVLKICLNLEPEFKKGIISWLASYDKPSFIRIVENIKNLITTQIMSCTSDLAYFRNLILFLKFLVEANKISNLVSYEKFYIELISEEEDPREEYLRWLENKYEDREEFTYMDYPWILDCSFKSKILEEESRFEMEREIKADVLAILGAGLSPTIDTLYALQNIFFKISVRRENLLEDTLNQISKSYINYKKPLKVNIFQAT